MAGHTAADVMTRSVVSVEPSTPIFEVARTLLENRIHRVLVIEKGPESELLVGNISLFDLARLLADGSQS
jgi:CBS domain-containing protein